MRKKRNTKFRAIDIAVILLCLCGFLASGNAFWQEYNSTLTRLNDIPIGTIVFKKRIVQRKFIDRVVWDRLKQTSPVYNGDTIRTIEFSEVLITFRNEVTHLTLDEKTLIQIFFNDIDGATINFSGGRLKVDSGSAGVKIISGSSEMKVDGQVSVDKNEEGLNLSVMEGKADFNGEEIESGSILAFDADGARDERPVIAMTSVRVSDRIGETAPVVFSWNTSNFRPDTRVIIETALDGNFTRIVKTAEESGVSAVIPMTTGSYWWRAYPVSGGSRQPANTMYPRGTFEVIAAPQPEPVLAVPEPVQPAPLPPPQPPPDTVAITPDSVPLPPPRPSTVAIAPEPAQPEPPRPSTVAIAPEPVVTRPPENTLARLTKVSGTGTIYEIFPPDGYVITTGQLQNASSIYFSWKGKSGEYQFALYRANGETFIPPSTADGSVYTLQNPRTLTEGSYVWQVFEKDKRGNWETLPGIAYKLFVTTAPVKILPITNPGELYGNR